MVVIEGNSRPQNQAIALAVEDAVLLEYQQQTIKQGHRQIHLSFVSKLYLIYISNKSDATDLSNCRYCYHR